MNAYTLKEHMELRKWNTEISRGDFEKLFYRTKEKVEFSFGGWDGKSYAGESRKASVYRTTVPGYEELRFIKVGKGIHYVDESRNILEKTTGEFHKGVNWLVDVARA